MLTLLYLKSSFFNFNALLAFSTITFAYSKKAFAVLNPKLFLANKSVCMED